VPQGAATSCGLSTVAISCVTDEGRLKGQYRIGGALVVMYADDGLIFAEEKSTI